eukprot:5561588-Amphidinium_carterae.1
MQTVLEQRIRAQLPLLEAKGNSKGCSAYNTSNQQPACFKDHLANEHIIASGVTKQGPTQNIHT